MSCVSKILIFNLAVVAFALVWNLCTRPGDEPDISISVGVVRERPLQSEPARRDSIPPWKTETGIKPDVNNKQK